MSILETGNKACGANRHTQVVRFSEQRSSEQIEKRGQLATIKASFSLEAVSDSTGRGGFVVSLMHDRPKRRPSREGTVSKLDWSKTLRGAALRAMNRLKPTIHPVTVKRRQEYNGNCCAAPDFKTV
jgi:hypothetical protein